MLAAIVAIHECGHFVAAKSQGIHVTKFAIGFGPRLLSYQVRTTSGPGPICCKFRQLLCKEHVASWTASNRNTGCSIARRMWSSWNVMAARVFLDISCGS